MIENQNNTFGITSLILGIIGLVLFWIPILGLFLSILAIVFSCKQKKIGPNGVATAGLVLGILGVIGGTLILFIMVGGFIASNFVRGYVSEELDKANQTVLTEFDCETEVYFGVYEVPGDIGNMAYLSSDGNEVTLSLMNWGDKEISFVISIIGNRDTIRTNDKNVFNPHIDIRKDTIRVGQLKSYQIIFDNSLVDMNRIEITPVIYTDGRDIICSKFSKTILKEELNIRDQQHGDPSYQAVQI